MPMTLDFFFKVVFLFSWAILNFWEFDFTRLMSIFLVSFWEVFGFYKEKAVFFSGPFFSPLFYSYDQHEAKHLLLLFLQSNWRYIAISFLNTGWNAYMLMKGVHEHALECSNHKILPPPWIRGVTQICSLWSTLPGFCLGSKRIFLSTYAMITKWSKCLERKKH